MDRWQVFLDLLFVFSVALAIRAAIDLMNPPSAVTDPDFWYYYAAAENPAWFHQVAGQGQPLATTYFAGLSAVLSRSLHYSLAMTMKLAFAAVDSLSAVGVYLLARELYSRRAGLLAGFAYATSAQALQDSVLKVRHDGLALALLIYASFLLARMTRQEGTVQEELPQTRKRWSKTKRLVAEARTKKQGLRFETQDSGYLPLAGLRFRHAPYLVGLLVIVYCSYLLTFYQFLVVTGTVGTFFFVSELTSLWDDLRAMGKGEAGDVLERRMALHGAAMAAMVGALAYMWFYFGVGNLIGWSFSSASYILELQPFNPLNKATWLTAFNWLNFYLVAVPLGLYFMARRRDAVGISVFLMTGALYAVALRGLDYFVLFSVLAYAVSAQRLNFRSVLALVAGGLAVLNVGIYSLEYPGIVQEYGTTPAQYDAALWIAQNSKRGTLVLANWDKGHLLEAVAYANVVWVGQYVPSTGALVSQAMYSSNESQALFYLRKLGSPAFIYLLRDTLYPVYSGSKLIGWEWYTGIGSPPPGFNMSNAALVGHSLLFRLLYDPGGLKEFKEVYFNSQVVVFNVSYAPDD